jgi:hypothetical protein
MFSQENTGVFLNEAYPNYNVIPVMVSTPSNYGTNNVYKGEPGILEDGRSLIASYTPEAIETNKLIVESGITNNAEYRRYMINNSQKIIENNFKEAQNDIGYIRRYANEKGEPNNKYIYKSVIDEKKPFGYENSDLKEMYLSKEQLNARKISPIVTQFELFSQKNI